MSDNTPPPPGGYGAAPPPPPPGYGPPPPGGYGAPIRNNTKAVWALVLGILGLLCCGFFTGIPAIILGKQAQGEVDRAGGMQSGRGMATAGFVLGIIACVWGVLSIILYATGVLTFNTSVSN